MKVMWAILAAALAVSSSACQMKRSLAADALPPTARASVIVETQPIKSPPDDISDAMKKFIEGLGAEVTAQGVYEEGTTATLTLSPFNGVKLNFLENSGQIKEIVFIYDRDNLYLVYSFNGDKDQLGTAFVGEGIKRRRVTGKDYSHQSEWTYSWSLKEDKAVVTFLCKAPSEETKRLIAVLAQDTNGEEIGKYEARILRNAKSVREWDAEEEVAPIVMLMDDPDSPEMTRLRTEYDLEKLTADAADDYERLRLILAWTQSRWQHSGDNKPSSPDPLTILEEAAEGKRFRCVEYAIVVAACARSLGLPSRVLALKREDVETKNSDAGHVVAEVWLDQFQKWVFVDGQWGAIVENDGIPLNAVEFQDAIARQAAGLKIRLCSKTSEEEYLAWVTPYLYYFDFRLDQRFYPGDSGTQPSPRGSIMLVPKGSKKPTVFQVTNSIRNCTYISNPAAFYPPMTKNAAR